MEDLKSEKTQSYYEMVGENRLQQAIREFYERCFADVMIGFLFFGHQIERIAQQQTDFVRAMLGGPLNYRGRSLEMAHQNLPLRPGHFARRLQILREVLEEYEVPQVCREFWLAQERALQVKISGALKNQNCRS